MWVFDLAALERPAQIIAIAGEDPRALAVAADGRSVAVAIFESGNGSTILAGGFDAGNIVPSLPNAVSDPRGPYGGQNPPPNAGNAFEPPINPQSTPPKVGLIVRQDASQRWMDDNDRDWTAMVSWMIHDDRAAGPFNAVAPAPVTNRTFTRTLARVLHRPAVLHAPEFALRAALGELASTLLHGQRALPAAAERLGFRFTYRELEPALESLNL